MKLIWFRVELVLSWFAQSTSRQLCMGHQAVQVKVDWSFLQCPELGAVKIRLSLSASMNKFCWNCSRVVQEHKIIQETASLGILKTFTVPPYLLCPHLLRGGSLFTTLEAIEQVQVAGLFWCTCSGKLECLVKGTTNQRNNQSYCKSHADKHTNTHAADSEYCIL